MRKVIFIALLIVCAMANGQGIKISALPSATSLTGSEYLPIVQGTTTKKTTAQSIAVLAGTALDSFWSFSFNNIHNVNTGNVGIGIDSPSYKLDVQGGEVNTSNQYRIAGGWGLQGNGTSYTELYGANGSDGLVLYDSGFYLGSWGNRTLIESNSGNGSMTYGDFDGTSVMTLKGGNMGIGNATPTYRLQVDNNIAIGNWEIRVGDLNNAELDMGVDGGAYLRLATGQQGQGKVWTSDGNGWGSWQSPSGGSKPINIVPEDTIIHGFVLSIDSFNVIGDTASSYPYIDTLFLPANPINNQVVEGKVIYSVLGGVKVLSISGDAVSSATLGSGVGQLIKWIFYNGKWY